MPLLVNYENSDSEDDISHKKSAAQEEMIILPSKKELALRERNLGASNKNKIVINLPTLENSNSEDEMEPAKKKLKYQSDSSLLMSLPPPKYVPTKETNRPLLPHSMSKARTAAQQQAIDDYEEEFDVADEDKIRKDINFLLSWVGEEDNIEVSSNMHVSALYKYHENSDVSEADSNTSRYCQHDAQYVHLPLPQNFVGEEQVSFNCSSSEYCESPPCTNASNPYDNQSKVQESIQSAVPEHFAKDKKFQRFLSSQKDSDMNLTEVDLGNHLKKYESVRLKAVTGAPSGKSNAAKISGLSKKKHQITYLAQRAKEMEEDLKNQWAENKFNKRQGANKYGF